MQNELENFVEKITDFDKMSYAEQIQYFAYFLQYICENDSFTAKDIKQCFNELAMKPYSNIPALLSSKSKGRDCEYIFSKSEQGFTISRNLKKSLDEKIGTPTVANPTNDLVDLSLVEHAPYYIQKSVIQMAKCYDVGLYDAVLVLMRKIFETLIIETFERFGCDDQIKDKNGTFLFLSDLIPEYLNSNRWNPSRNINSSLIKIKKYGDLSAHNRRFLAKKTDIDSIKTDMRQSLQEIILNIDYPNWNKQS